MMNVNSDLLPIVTAIQFFKTENKAYQGGKTKWNKITKEFYDKSKRMTAMKNFSQQTRNDRRTDHWKDIDHPDSELAFVIDMDAQFVFVPKVWIRNILLLKILRAM